jgi:phosphoribosylaminoimidazolecarboxamide formyltransferase/IMP cyclohydrolase
MNYQPATFPVNRKTPGAPATYPVASSSQFQVVLWICSLKAGPQQRRRPQLCHGGVTPHNLTQRRRTVPSDVEQKRIRRALLSVTDKTGLVEFARVLAELGVELISTGGTAKALREGGLTVKDIRDLTGFPEMLDGRVKTLHPRVHGGLLYIRGNAEHEAAVAEHGIQPIDMVVVNLYAFEKTAAQPGVAFGHVIENIDIGGPSMVRSAAKNFEDVAIVTRAADYPDLIQELKSAPGATLSRATRWRLAKQAFATTAAYDAAIAGTLERIAEAPLREAPAAPDASAFPSTLRINFPLAQALRYGENPHQRAALYADGSGLGIAGARQLQGKELSYNNLVDLDACWELAQEFDEPATIIVKHTNPCGAATGSSILEAYQKALACDPVSAFGGVIGINREVDGAAAEEIAKLFVEAIAAPGFTSEARERLAAKKNLRLVEVRPAPPRPVVKNVSGGLLLQDADTGHITESELKVVTWRPPTAEELPSLLFAWRVCKHVKSNAIVYARDGQTLGVGAGQMSRVDAARFGAMKAVLPLKDCVAASDAFFPFPDGLEAVAQAGATAVIQPGGSVRDDEVIAAADKLGLAMVFTGIRHFRH